MRVAVVNLDFAQGGDRALIRDACDGAAAVLAVEAIRGRGKKARPVDLEALAPKGWAVCHDRTDTGTAGVALLYRPDALAVHGWAWHPVTALPGLRKRGALLADVTDRSDGGRGTLAASHFPPPRIPGGRTLHGQALRKLLAKHRAVLFGGDVNMKPPSKVGDLLGLDADGHQVMALAWSSGVQVGHIRRRGADNTDHPIISAKVTLPRQEKPPVTYRYLTNLADVCRAAGLTVVEVDGWQTRGRPSSTGGFDPVGVLVHHTATGRNVSDADTVRLLVNGRTGLPGPLCQLGLARDGTVYVIAAGRGNHAGKAQASGTVAAGDGNRLYIGVEAFNDGVGEPWPKVQYDAYVRLAAALCQGVTGNSVQTVRGHKETSVTGKIDPTFDMDVFRADVAAAMTVPAPAPAKPKKPTRSEVARDLIKRAKAHRKAARQAGRETQRRRLSEVVKFLRETFPKR